MDCRPRCPRPTTIDLARQSPTTNFCFSPLKPAMSARANHRRALCSICCYTQLTQRRPCVRKLRRSVSRGRGLSRNAPAPSHAVAGSFQGSLA